jgi:hypothetical protein
VDWLVSKKCVAHTFAAVASDHKHANAAVVIEIKARKYRKEGMIPEQETRRTEHLMSEMPWCSYPTLRVNVTTGVTPIMTSLTQSIIGFTSES